MHDDYTAIVEEQCAIAGGRRHEPTARNAKVARNGFFDQPWLYVKHEGQTVRDDADETDIKRETARLQNIQLTLNNVSQQGLRRFVDLFVRQPPHIVRWYLFSARLWLQELQHKRNWLQEWVRYGAPFPERKWQRQS